MAVLVIRLKPKNFSRLLASRATVGYYLLATGWKNSSAGDTDLTTLPTLWVLEAGTATRRNQEPALC